MKIFRGSSARGKIQQPLSRSFEKVFEIGLLLFRFKLRGIKAGCVCGFSEERSPSFRLYFDLRGQICQFIFQSIKNFENYEKKQLVRNALCSTKKKGKKKKKIVKRQDPF